MAECMSRIADDDALFERMSNFAISHRIKEFEADTVLSKWDQII